MIYIRKGTHLWRWHCAHDRCPADSYHSRGFAANFEFVMEEAGEHLREYHRTEHLPHDL